jgi:S1-C subfamily serine protease
MPEAARLNLKWVGLGAAILVALVAYFAVRHSTRSATTEQQILSDASFSVSRVQRLDPSGARAPLGLAFAIEEGVMATTCHGLPAGGSLAIDNGERAHAARVAIADEVLDVCRLAVTGGASRAMIVAREPPRTGDKVYVVHLDAGKASLDEGQVKGIVPTAEGNLIEITQPVGPDATGGPLLDANGRVVGIVTAPHRFGEGRSIALPARWIAEARTRQVVPPKIGRGR